MNFTQDELTQSRIRDDTLTYMTRQIYMYLLYDNIIMRHNI